MDNFRMDSHKLMYHVPRVSQWLTGENIYPIYVEIGPSGGCNHRCIFCAFDYLGYKARFIDKNLLMDILSEMVQRGVKSVMYAGEGEPLLHKDIGELILHTKEIGIDVAITTNATPFNGEIALKCLGALTWIKASINAGTRETYSKIHRTKPADFDRVLENLANAVRIKKENNYTCTIGTQLLLLPENYQEAIILAEKLKNIGVDYLVMKPYSQHPMSHTTIYKDLQYDVYYNLNDSLQQFADDKFKVIFRRHTMEKLKDSDRHYLRCQALPFWAYIDAGGNVWGCSAYLGNNDFLYGNIYEDSFSGIWEGERRKKSLQMVDAELDISQCRRNCRMDEINRYLWELKHPSAHLNFI